MSITIDATSTGGGTATAYSFNHTVTTRYPRILVVGVASRGPNEDVSTVTYAGLSLTKIIDSNFSGVNSEIWYIINPPTGTNSITVTHVGDMLTSDAGGISFYNAGIFDKTYTNAQSGALGTPTFTTSSNNQFGVHVYYKKGGTVTVPSGTETIVFAEDPNGNADRAGMSAKSFPTAGNNTMSNWNASGDHAQSAVTFTTSFGEGGSFLYHLI